MDIFQLDELTDNMMKLSHNEFFNFLECALDKDLCQLFRVQAIRDMSSLLSLTVDQIIQILNFDVPDLNDLKKSLGFVTSDGNFHLRLGLRNSLERLLFLVKSKKNSSVKNLDSLNKNMENDVCKKLTALWKKASSTSNDTNIPILIPWVDNIIENLQRTKNKFSYDDHIQQFALLLFILGGRNCYEFLRLNLPAALPHISKVELLIRNQETRMIECEFRFQLLKEYSRLNNCNYVYVSEDSTSSVCRNDYDAQMNSFIGFSSPLINGIPKPNFFRTENFDQLKKWFDEIDKSNFINLHMIKSVVVSAPPLILSAYGSNNKAEAIDILKKWLFIYNQCLIQGVRVISVSTDSDPRYLRAMPLCSWFFVELPNLNLYKHSDLFEIKISKQWSWFLMKEQQIVLAMQDPIHIATKFRNRLLSTVAKLKMGSYSIDKQHLIDLVELTNKIEHNLIKCDIDPKDRQNSASCLRISSETILNLFDRNENTKGTYVYLSLLQLIISGFIEKSTTIEERLFDICPSRTSCNQDLGQDTSSSTKIHIVVDNSNLFIGSQLGQGENGEQDAGVRINVANLVKIIEDEKNQNIKTRIVGGSKPPRKARVWTEWENCGYTCLLGDRSMNDEEVFLDDMLHAQMLRLISKNKSHGKGVKQHLTLITGDGNANDNRTSFPDTVSIALTHQWTVDMWSWKASLSSKFLAIQRKYPSQIEINYLDAFRSKITFKQKQEEPQQEQRPQQQRQQNVWQEPQQQRPQQQRQQNGWQEPQQQTPQQQRQQNEWQGPQQQRPQQQRQQNGRQEPQQQTLQQQRQQIEWQGPQQQRSQQQRQQNGRQEPQQQRPQQQQQQNGRQEPQQQRPQQQRQQNVWQEPQQQNEWQGPQRQRSQQQRQQNEWQGPQQQRPQQQRQQNGWQEPQQQTPQQQRQQNGWQEPQQQTPQQQRQQNVWQEPQQQNEWQGPQQQRPQQQRQQNGWQEPQQQRQQQQQQNGRQEPQQQRPQQQQQQRPQQQRQQNEWQGPQQQRPQQQRQQNGWQEPQQQTPQQQRQQNGWQEPQQQTPQQQRQQNVWQEPQQQNEWQGPQQQRPQQQRQQNGWQEPQQQRQQQQQQNGRQEPQQQRPQQQQQQRPQQQRQQNEWQGPQQQRPQQQRQQNGWQDPQQQTPQQQRQQNGWQDPQQQTPQQQRQQNVWQEPQQQRPQQQRQQNGRQEPQQQTLQQQRQQIEWQGPQQQRPQQQRQQNGRQEPQQQNGRQEPQQQNGRQEPQQQNGRQEPQQQNGRQEPQQQNGRQEPQQQNGRQEPQQQRPQQQQQQRPQQQQQQRPQQQRQQNEWQGPQQQRSQQQRQQNGRQDPQQQTPQQQRQQNVWQEPQQQNEWQWPQQQRSQQQRQQNEWQGPQQQRSQQQRQQNGWQEPQQQRSQQQRQQNGWQ